MMAEVIVFRQVRKAGGLVMPDREIAQQQANYIYDRFPDAALYPPGSTPGGAVPAEFFYRADSLLTRTRDEQNVLGILRTLGIERGGVSLERGEIDSHHPHPIAGLTLIRLVFQPPGKATDLRLANPQAEILYAALEAIEQQLGRGTAAPDHLISVTSTPGSGETQNPDIVGWCPDNEPTPQPCDTPPQPGVSRSRCDGRGTFVAVVDGGLIQSAVAGHPWMHGVTGDADPAPDGGSIEPYGGHGTFIASIIRAMAPRAEVRVAAVLTTAGAAYESDVVRELLPVLDWGPDVISLSAGTHTWNNGGLLSFHVFVNGPLREQEKTVLVAAAGNDGADWKFSPAEMEAVIGVGALGPPGDARASFSDYGDWVKVYAPGVNLVQAFGYGSYTYMTPPANQPDPATFDGMAMWSGTSFSTPIVAGLIAARMSGTGESARQAADALLRLARAQALPGVGPVLRPGQACLRLCGCEETPAPCGPSRGCECT
jgi:subtilisin family serine protease